jgi:imidazolonepropionase-like amidohydrolase
MGVTVFTNAKVLDGENPSRAGQTIVVEGNRIKSILDDPGAGFQRGDEIYDLGGRTVMPGMVIGHYHATYEGIGPGSPPVGMEAPPALQTLRAVRHLRMALHAGFTSVVSAGAPYGIDASCKIGIEEGLIEGPRIMAGSRDVSTTGHIQDCFYQWHWGPGMGPQTNIVDGADGFRRAVREEVKRGAEIIKVFASTGHGLPPARYSMELSEDELSAAISTAHERGVKVRAHIARKDALMASVKLGIDVVDHGDGLDAECIELMLKKGTFLVPSLYFPHCVSRTFKGPAPDEMKADLDKMLQVVPHANEAGLKITLGDDYGATPLNHGQYGEELAYYVTEAGIPPLDVIRWATRNGAEMMGMGGELGRIKEGYLADLLIVDADPTVDMSILKTPETLRAIMKNGRFVKNTLDRSAHSKAASPAGSSMVKAAHVA